MSGSPAHLPAVPRGRLDQGRRRRRRMRRDGVLLRRAPRGLLQLLVPAAGDLEQHLREVGLDRAITGRVLRAHVELGVVPAQDLVGGVLPRQSVSQRIDERPFPEVQLPALAAGPCLDVAGLLLQIDHLDDRRQRYPLHDTSRTPKASRRGVGSGRVDGVSVSVGRGGALLSDCRRISHHRRRRPLPKKVAPATAIGRPGHPFSGVTARDAFRPTLPVCLVTVLSRPGSGRVVE